MFLKEVFYYNRIMFAGIILFILAFAYINIKWGAVATPIYTPGMFSGKMYHTDTLTTYKVYHGNELIDFNKMHFTKREMITVSISRYLQQNQVNRSVMDIMRKVPVLGSLVNDSWLNETTNQQFSQWLVKLVTGKTDGADELSVYKIAYSWKNDRLTELNHPQKLF